MESLRRYLPWMDLAGYSRKDLGPDVGADLAVAFLSIPKASPTP